MLNVDKYHTIVEVRDSKNSSVALFLNLYLVTVGVGFKTLICSISRSCMTNTQEEAADLPLLP